MRTHLGYIVRCQSLAPPVISTLPVLKLLATMHLTLAIDEIFRNVISLASFDKSTLRALALTCRSFVDPALDHLWFQQRGLGNLIKVLPLDLLAEPQECVLWTEQWEDLRQSTARTCKLLNFRRMPVAEDWIRFDYYARRVVDLTFDGYDDPYTPSPAFFEVLRARHRPIVPQIKYLKWSLCGAPSQHLECISYFDVFLGPNLESLELITDAGGGSVTPQNEHGFVPEDLINLDYIPMLSPHLDVLALRIWGTHALKARLSMLFASLHNLTDLECHLCSIPLTYDILEALGTLPLLSWLSIRISTMNLNKADGVQEYLGQIESSLGEPGISAAIPIMDPLDHRPPARIQFPALKTLTLSSEGTDTSTCALKAMQLPVLHSLTFWTWRQSYAEVLSLLMELKKSCTTASLEELFVYPQGSTDANCTVARSTLLLLSGYPKLKELYLGYTLDETERLDDIQELWPHLNWSAITGLAHG